MREWNLRKGDPLHLCLAADSRFTTPDYLNDHIWELALSGGEPAALAVSTTFGLRARQMRLFPRFLRGDSDLINPDQFDTPPAVVHLYPNYLDVQCVPIPGVDVRIEYWMVTSQVMAGRVTLSNRNILPETFTFEWGGQLNPLGDGYGLTVQKMGSSLVLAGKSDDLHPVCILTGNPKAGKGPYAALGLEMTLDPGNSRQVSWSIAALDSAQASLDAARLATARAWDAEIARIELLNASQEIQVFSARPDWDTALMLSQRAANNLWFQASPHLPFESFVQSREPNQGFSLRGDGSDYGSLWNGQTALESMFLSGLLLPGQVQRLAGLIENFLSSQTQEGFIDWRPGLAGQRSKRLVQPLLACLAWEIHSAVADESWLARIYSGLIQLVRYWFGADADHDSDGFPEWTHPYQTGLDEIPFFNPVFQHGQGIDPASVESPALGAMLYRECTCLGKIADLLGFKEDSSWLDQAAKKLRNQVESTLNTHRWTYFYRDATTHASPEGSTLLRFEDSGTYLIRAEFSQPQQVLIRLQSRDGFTRQTHLILHGKNDEGTIHEEITPRQISWLHGYGHYTSRNHFTHIKEILVRNFLPGDAGELITPDFTSEDITLLLPLWAEIPNQEHARQIVENTILKRYLQPFGLPVCPQDRQPADPETMAAVSIPWNQMIIEGMLAYDYRTEAARLFEALMSAVILNLKRDQSFWSLYDSITGRGGGERNVLRGMAPLGLFLKLIGVQSIHNNRVQLEGQYPFASPVTVQYRGIKIEFRPEQTRVTFPGGQQAVVSGPGPHTITLP